MTHPIYLINKKTIANTVIHDHIFLQVIQQVKQDTDNTTLLINDTIKKFGGINNILRELIQHCDITPFELSEESINDQKSLNNITAQLWNIFINALENECNLNLSEAVRTIVANQVFNQYWTTFKQTAQLILTHQAHNSDKVTLDNNPAYLDFY